MQQITICGSCFTIILTRIGYYDKTINDITMIINIIRNLDLLRIQTFIYLKLCFTVKQFISYPKFTFDNGSKRHLLRQKIFAAVTDVTILR